MRHNDVKFLHGYLIYSEIIKVSIEKNEDNKR